MAAPTSDDSELVVRYGGVLLGGLATALAAIGGWLFRRVIDKHDQEIKSIKEGIAAVDTKLDSKVDLVTWEQNRRESRDNVIDLHEKIDRNSEVAEQRHRELLNILLEQRGRKRAGD